MLQTESSKGPQSVVCAKVRYKNVSLDRDRDRGESVCDPVIVRWSETFDVFDSSVFVCAIFWGGPWKFRE